MVKKKKAQPKNRTFYIVLALLAVVGIGALSYVSSSKRRAPAFAQVDTTLPAIESEGYVIGSPDAPIEVVEFGDFECPTCARFAELVEPDVRTHLVNTGRIRFRYVDFPLDMHAHAWHASRAAACADEQGKFWEMHDLIFANQHQWNGSATNNPDARFKEYAGRIAGVDRRRFNECVDSRRMQAKIQAHHAIALKNQAPGTPHFVAGDLSGAYMTFDQFKRFVDSATVRMGGGGGTAGGR